MYNEKLNDVFSEEPCAKLLQEEASKGVVRVGELHHAVEQSGKIPKSDQMAVGQLIMLAAAQVR